jgi:phenylacetate-coenzyme A ligase PaaK-like adenylate-forming protein
MKHLKEFLSATVMHCYQHSAYYRKEFDRLNIDPNTIESLEDLRAFPPISKEDVKAHPEIICDSVTPVTINTTSGTTHDPLVVYISLEELEVRKKLQRGIAKIAYNFRKNDPTVTLNIFSILHNNIISEAPGFLMIPTYYVEEVPTSFEQIKNALERPYFINGKEKYISTIISELRGFSIFTRFLNEFPSHIEVIRTGGSYLSPHVRRWLMETWKTPILHSYGMNEVYGMAHQCAPDSSYHFTKTMLVELLDIETKEPVKEGVGVLVLTTLFPFHQTMPLIRYWTGDVVQIEHGTCDKCGYKGVSIKSIKGRLTNSIKVDDSRVYSTELYDIIDTFPEFGLGNLYFKGYIKEKTFHMHIYVPSFLNFNNEIICHVIRKKIEDIFSHTNINMVKISFQDNRTSLWKV